MTDVRLNVWGDSIAKGIVFDEVRGRYAICRENCFAMLAADGVRVVNHAVMGQTSADGLERMHVEDLSKDDLVIIEYGGNDCDLDWNAVSEHPERKQFGRVPIDAFEKNLMEMVRRVIEAGAKPLLVAPPPILSERYFDFVARGLNPANILHYLGDVDAIARWQSSYVERMRRVSAATGTILIDLHAVFEAAPDTGKLFCTDGIHPNAAGHAMILETFRLCLGKICIHD